MNVFNRQVYVWEQNFMSDTQFIFQRDAIMGTLLQKGMHSTIGHWILCGLTSFVALIGNLYTPTLNLGIFQEK